MAADSNANTSASDDDDSYVCKVILFIRSPRNHTIIEIIDFRETLVFDKDYLSLELEELIIDTYTSYFIENNLNIETLFFALDTESNIITLKIEPLSIQKKINMIKLSSRSNNGDDVEMFTLCNFLYKSHTSEELKRELTNFFVNGMQLGQVEIISMCSNLCPLGQSIFFLTIEKLDVCVRIW